MKYNVEILNDTVEDDTDNTVSLRVYAPDTGASYTVYTCQNGTWASTSSSRDGSYLVFKTMDRDLQFAVVKAHHGPLFYILIVLIVLAVIVAVLRLLYCRKLKKAVEAGTMTEEEAGNAAQAGPAHVAGRGVREAPGQARRCQGSQGGQARRRSGGGRRLRPSRTAPEAEAEPEVTAEDNADVAEAPADEAAAEETEAQDSDAPQHP